LSGLGNVELEMISPLSILEFRFDTSYDSGPLGTLYTQSVPQCLGLESIGPFTKRPWRYGCRAGIMIHMRRGSAATFKSVCSCAARQNVSAACSYYPERPECMGFQASVLQPKAGARGQTSSQHRNPDNGIKKRCWIPQMHGILAVVCLFP
jgi:hypothetical protein